MRKFVKRIKLLCFIYGLLILLCIVSELTEKSAHFYPAYNKLEKTALLAAKDSRMLFYQTGLSAASINALKNNPDFSPDTLFTYQKNFFAPITITCRSNSIISKEEYVSYHTPNPILLAPLEDGDILITSASHTFFWRNGHAALVTDASKGITLESVVLGENSSFQSVEKWKKFPNFAILRLKNTSPELRKEIAQSAEALLHDIPYDFTVGILTQKEKASNEINSTQCAHLIWQAYSLFGYDIDSDGGPIVTPSDILHSDLLEIIQIYGLNPSDFTKSVSTKKIS